MSGVKSNLCRENTRSKFAWSKWICGGYYCLDRRDYQRKCANFKESAALVGTCMYEDIRAEFHGGRCPEAVADRLADMKMEGI